MDQSKRTQPTPTGPMLREDRARGHSADDVEEGVSGRGREIDLTSRSLNVSVPSRQWRDPMPVRVMIHSCAHARQE
eukprot:3937305-Rhodomonas_salina.13